MFKLISNYDSLRHEFPVATVVKLLVSPSLQSSSINQVSSQLVNEVSQSYTRSSNISKSFQETLVCLTFAFPSHFHRSYLPKLES